MLPEIKVRKEDDSRKPSRMKSLQNTMKTHNK